MNVKWRDETYTVIVVNSKKLIALDRKHVTCLIVGCQQTLTIIRHSYDGFVTFAEVRMGISRDHWHKRRATGGRRVPIRKKRKFELARPAAMTKLAPQRIHTLRVRGGQSP